MAVCESAFFYFQKRRGKNQEIRVAVKIKVSAPKVQYYNEVLQSESTFTSTTIAKELGLGAPTLHKLLQEKKVIYKHNGVWVLYYAYQNKGLSKTRTHAYTDSEGNSRTSVILVWTEKGRQLIHSLLNPKVRQPISSLEKLRVNMDKKGYLYTAVL